MPAFDTPLTRQGDTLTGPFRSPRQMLADQEYDGHTSVHDGDTAAKLGLAGAPIEGPTHFSQFDPVGTALWGAAWFEHGCISAHFENMVVEGEQVRPLVSWGGGNAAVIHEVCDLGVKAGLCDVFPIGAITRGLEGEVMAELGEMVLRKLYGLDKVAYVRFASVYKKFETMDEFLAEVDGIKQGHASDLSNFMTAVIDERAFTRVSSAIDRAHAESFKEECAAYWCAYSDFWRHG